MNHLAIQAKIAACRTFEKHGNDAAFGDRFAEKKPRAAARKVVDPGALEFVVIAAEDGPGSGGSASVSDGDAAIADALRSGVGQIHLRLHRKSLFRGIRGASQTYVGNGDRAKNLNAKKDSVRSERCSAPSRLHHVLEIALAQFANKVAAELPGVFFMNRMNDTGEQRFFVALLSRHAKVQK